MYNQCTPGHVLLHSSRNLSGLHVVVSEPRRLLSVHSLYLYCFHQSFNQLPFLTHPLGSKPSRAPYRLPFGCTPSIPIARPTLVESTSIATSFYSDQHPASSIEQPAAGQPNQSPLLLASRERERDRLSRSQFTQTHTTLDLGHDYRKGKQEKEKEKNTRQSVQLTTATTPATPVHVEWCRRELRPPLSSHARCARISWPLMPPFPGIQESDPLVPIPTPCLAPVLLSCPLTRLDSTRTGRS